MNESTKTKSTYLVQFPVVLFNPCYDHRSINHSRAKFSQALNAAVKQIYSLSALLLLYFTILLLSAQIIGLTLMVCCAVSLPLGLQFMMVSLFCITTLAFKIMS